MKTILALLLAGTLLLGIRTLSVQPRRETEQRKKAVGLLQLDRGDILFVDAAARRGIDHVWPERPRPVTPSGLFGCGCAFLEFDGDGWQDVLLVAEPHPVLYRNTGDGQFENVTAGSGLSKLDGDWCGCAVGDYNGDGRLDILLTGRQRLALLRNADGAAFDDITAAAGLDPRNREHWGTSAGWMDLNGDGWLDLVLLNYVSPGEHAWEWRSEFVELWRNRGDGTFQVVPQQNGMQYTHGQALALAFTDLDGDGRVDFYIGNDGTPADFMHNRGGMKFENTGDVVGVAYGREFGAMAAQGADFADYNRDGLVDLTVTDFQDNGFGLFRNDQGVFTEVSKLTGIAELTRPRLGFGAKWIDFDNDGWPDLCYANGHIFDNVEQAKNGAQLRQSVLLLRNLAGRRFESVLPALDNDVGRKILGRGMATGDINNDGRVDLLIVDYEGPPMLLENHTPARHHWITLDLRGLAPNLFAYGVKVTAHAGEQVWVAEVSPASSFLSSSDPRIHWGLGAVDKLGSLTIHWPSGLNETLRDVDVDRVLRIEEDPAATPARTGRGPTF